MTGRNSTPDSIDKVELTRSGGHCGLFSLALLYPSEYAS